MKSAPILKGSLDWAIPDNDSSPLDYIIQQELHEQINVLLKILTPDETRIITLYFGLNNEEPHSDAAISVVFDTTRERIRQSREKALQKLRHPANSKILKTFID